MPVRPLLVSLVWPLSCACASDAPIRLEERGRANDANEPVDAGGEREADAGLQLDSFSIEVRSSDPVYVDLEGRGVVDVERDSLGWDLRFEGFRVFTNSGPSGPGDGAAFGPSDELDLLFDTVPGVPLRPDRAVGPLSAWYLYEGGFIYSRYHLYGVRTATSLWKLQILGYYGGPEAQASALYQLRYARVTEQGSERTITVRDLDATGGGVHTSGDASLAGCLDLEAGQVRALTRGELTSRQDWHVCFLRNDAFTNGGLSGPGDVTVADLDPGFGLDVEELAALTAEGELERFEALDYASLSRSDLRYHGDELVASFFDDHWVDAPGADAVPVPGTFIVRSADGERYYILLCTSIEGASEEAPGTVTFRIKEVFE